MRNVLARTPVRLALPLILLAGAPAVHAQQPAEPPPQQREHVVRRGDTLWDLARTYLGNPFSWPSIFEANRNVVENPHWIYPSERLIIPPLLQRPALLQEEPIGVPRQPAVAPPPGFVPAAEAGDPGAPPTLVSTIDMRRPLMTTGQYLAAPWLQERPAPAQGARITAKADPAAGSGRLPAVLLPNERVHVAVSGLAAGVGDTLVVVRPGRQLGAWGQVMQPLGLLRVETAVAGEATARLVAQFGDARVGDLVMRMGPVPSLEPRDPVVVDAGPAGYLLEFLSSEPLQGVSDMAFISLGHADGIGIGDEFAVYVPSGTSLPAEQVGVVRVVRVGDRTATVRVVNVTSAALGDGLPVRLIRKMP